MKKVLLLVAVALAFTFTAMAQDTSAQTTTTTTTKTKSKKAKGESAATEAKEAKAGKEMKGPSLTGCLGAGTEPNTYTLTKGKKVTNVTGMDLSQHVGHEVKLTGTWEKGSAAADKKGGKEFKATNAEHVADTCNAMSAKGEKTTKTKSKTKTKTETATPPGF